MKCTVCKNEAFIRIKRHHVAFCPNCFKKFILKQTLQAIKKYKMFFKKEPVLLAVSGGKDSMSLWSVLTELDDHVTAIHLDLGIPNFSEYSRKIVEKFAKERGLPLIVLDIKKQIGNSIPEIKKMTGRPACSVCGLTKRYLLNQYAYHHHFSVYATGHNLDDEAATLLGNVLRWRKEYLLHQNPCLPSEIPGLIKKVKPFYTLTDEEILRYAQLMEIPYYDGVCPLSRQATSIEFKEALNKIENQSPGTKHYFLFRFLEKRNNLFQEEDQSASLQNCSQCGMPTTQNICAFCVMMETVKSKSLLFDQRKDEVKNENNGFK